MSVLHSAAVDAFDTPLTRRGRTTAPMNRPLHVIGAPCDLGGNRRGAAMGPEALRTAGLIEALVACGCKVRDGGNVAVPSRANGSQDPQKRFIADIATVAGAVYEESLQALRGGAFPIVLGGDHSISAGSVAATATHLRAVDDRPIGLIWIDAHGDMNTPATTLTGNVHGMPLAALLGDEPRELAAIGGWTRKVAPANTVILGLRSVDVAEQRAIEAAGVSVFTMEDVGRRGIARVMSDVLKRVLDGTCGVHVSLDLDACDPQQAPGVSTPVGGGLFAHEAHVVMQMIAASSEIVALDIVEVNPACDVRNATAELGIALALSLLAQGAE